MSPRGENKPLVYLILGAADSGRRALVADLIEGGLGPEDSAAVISAESEASGGPTWRWAGEGVIAAEVPEGASHIFFITDGRANPIDQIEAFKVWLRGHGLELARVLCVVNCRLAEAHPQLLAWYDALVHFADVALLNRREGVANKWMSDFQARYRSEHYPCHFELVRDDSVKNPALILEPRALRISHAFDDEVDWNVVGEEPGDEDEAEGEETVEVVPEEDPYFVRLNGGRRVKELPDIGKYVPATSSPPQPRQTP